MLSKSKVKFIRSLEQKKCRRQEQAFVAEGHKTVGDILCEGFVPLLIIATEEWHSPIPLPKESELIRVTEEELRKASLLLHPQQVIGVFKLPTHTNTSNDNTDDVTTLCRSGIMGLDSLVLCLDGIQDPGNLGTIIRTADWFGIKDIVCSPQTADAYAPKVVQATMGSIARVNIHYTDLPEFLRSLNPDIPIYGTLLDGNNIYSEKLSSHGVIVMGNEGNGISDEVRPLLTHRLLIPPHQADNRTAESLNVSIATAITLSLFRACRG